MSVDFNDKQKTASSVVYVYDLLSPFVGIAVDARSMPSSHRPLTLTNKRFVFETSNSEIIFLSDSPVLNTQYVSR